jgi:hypothetical protein
VFIFEVPMPRNGEFCTKFGVYKNLCCAEEIVIVEGVIFPDCRKHPKLTTEWKSLVTDQPILHVSDLNKNKKNNSAA